jgi:HSP20 family molecular chaperone IbpA
MICKRCGTELKDGWQFCPKCGARRNGDPADIMGRDFFSQILKGFRESSREFDEMGKALEKDMAAGGISPGQKRSFGPFKVRITSKRVPRPGRAGTPSGEMDAQRSLRNESADEGSGPPPRVTEEPPADMRRIGDRMLVDIGMPGVKREGVSIKELKSSKAYFKILKKPPGSRIVRRSFSGSVLHLEFS